MFITVPMRKNKGFKSEKKHQDLLFKEISYNAIFQTIKEQEELRKKNGKKLFKSKILNDTPARPFRKTMQTLRKTSSVSQNVQIHRPSVSSILSTSKEKFNHSFFKTEGDFYERKKFSNFNQVIPQKSSERQSDSITQNNQTPKKLNQQIQDTENQNQSRNSRFSKKQNEQPPAEECKKEVKTFKRKKTITLLDLKVRNIEQIIKNAGKSQHLDFGAFAQKDHKSITKSCWNKFYEDVMKNTNRKPSNVQRKMQKLRKATTSHQKRGINETSNGLHELFVHKKPPKATKSESASLNITPRDKGHHATTSLYFKNNPLQNQKMWEYYNFVKGFELNDEFSKKMSLANYRKSVPKYYILKNSEDAVKSSIEYQKINMENFRNYKPEQVLFFVYLNENQYKFETKKNEGYMKEVVP